MTADAPAAAIDGICGAAYRPPVRRDDQAPTPRDDMFAVGVLIYEMLTARLPQPKPEPPMYLSAMVPPGPNRLT